jgi:hypothetical protein
MSGNLGGLGLFWGGGVTWGCGLPLAGHTQHSQANLTAGGPRQSLTSEIRPTPLLQEVPSPRVGLVLDLELQLLALQSSRGACQNTLCCSKCQLWLGQKLGAKSVSSTG